MVLNRSLFLYKYFLSEVSVSKYTSIYLKLTLQLTMFNISSKYQLLANFHIQVILVPWVATMATWARARARGAGFHGPVKTPLLAPVKGLRDPATMTVEQGGGGGGKGQGP